MEYKIRFWIPFAVTSTLLCLLIYITAQQTLRQGANEPQIQISQDLANALAKHQTIPTYTTLPPIELAHDTSPFIILYDKSGQLTSSTALLHNKTPRIPQGALDFAKAHGQNRLTWQPDPQVRIATIVTYYNNGKSRGYVLAGRSLREVEEQENTLLHRTIIVWIGTLIASFLSVLIFIKVPRKK